MSTPESPRSGAPADPGTISLTLWSPAPTASPSKTPGFTKFVQENIPLAARGDVTVDATLQDRRRARDCHGGRRGQPGPVQHQQAGDVGGTKIAQGIPQLYRSPFVLATLDPSVLKDDANVEYNPFNSWGPNR